MINADNLNIKSPQVTGVAGKSFRNIWVKIMQQTEPLVARPVEATPEALVLVLADRRVPIAWERCSAKLAAASEAERRDLEVSPGGYGIHWPRLGEDLSVGGLLRH